MDELEVRCNRGPRQFPGTRRFESNIGLSPEQRPVDRMSIVSGAAPVWDIRLI